MAQRSGQSDSLIIGVLALTGIVVSLAQTLVVPILGQLPLIFSTSAANTSWIVTVTLLAGAVSTPVLGRLGDMYGKKRILLVAITPFILGSALCAVSTSLLPMILGRALQGLANGMVPLGISLLHDVLPPGRVGSAIALMSSSMGIGGALGLPIAAAVTQFANWRVLFWATAVAAAIAAVALWRALPAGRRPRTSGRFDAVGAVGLAIGLVALLLGVSKGAEWGWRSALTIGCLAVAVVVLLAWGRYELGRSQPLVDLRTTGRPVVLLTNLASILVGFAMYAMNLILPQVMQLPVDLGYGLGQGMFQMGLWIAPMGLGMFIVSTPGARLSRCRGPRTTLMLANLVIAAGYGLAALILATVGNRAPGDAGGPVVLTLILLSAAAGIAGCGTGLAFGAMPALIMGGVPAQQKAAANGFNALMRSLGTTSSAAVIGILLASMTQPIGGHAVPTQGGFVTALLVGGVAALVAAGFSFAIPGRANTRPEH
jgi:MFS family permease